MNATRLAAAIFLALFAHSVMAFGLFPHGGGGSSNNGSAARSAPSQSMVSPAPEPETYLLMLVGLGAVAWVVKKRNKK